MSACNHSTVEHRRRTKSNGAVVVCAQCTVCGASLGEAPRHKFNVAALPEYDPDLNNIWREELHAKEREQFELERATHSGKWWDAYHAYLEGYHWSKVRNQVLSRDQDCTRCYNARATQVHHLTYSSFNRLGFSFPVECAGLCVPCHNLLHEKAPNGD